MKISLINLDLYKNNEDLLPIIEKVVRNQQIIRLNIYYFLNILSNCFISSLISLSLLLILLFFLIIGIIHQACIPIKISISIIRSNVPDCTFNRKLDLILTNRSLI